MREHFIIQEFDHLKKSDQKIKKSLYQFIQKPISYRKKFLQTEFDNAFDGYSYIGQKDSTNQYETDMLHSFVLSDFNAVDEFPDEFHDFLTSDWKELKLFVKELEINLIRKIGIPHLESLYEQTVGYMMSCNYYPKPIDCKIKPDDKKRLSSHKDVSLFSSFPFGISKGLSYKNEFSNRVYLGDIEKPITFSGYFLEVVSDGEISALDHQVELPQNLESERFSFAIFSIPKPGCTIITPTMSITAEEYYQKYLSLF